MIKDKILVGKIIAAHGIKGEVKIKSFAEDILLYKSFYYKDGTGVKLKLRSPKNDVFITSIAGVTTRNDAETMIGKELFVEKKDLPALSENEFFYHQLIGLKILDKNGNEIGTIKATQNFGAGDLIVATFEKGEEYLPFNDAIFPMVNIEEGFVVVELPEYL